MDARWDTYGRGDCPHCGLRVSVAQLLSGTHYCEVSQRQAHESRLLADEIQATLVAVEEFLASAAGEKRLAFAAWCREHGR